jgi:tetratricopeptide (TPR) repeat protein
VPSIGLCIAGPAPHLVTTLDRITTSSEQASPPPFNVGFEGPNITFARRRMPAHPMPLDVAQPDIPPPEDTEVLRIRVLMEQRQFVTALAAAEALAAEYPRSRDALYMVAVCQRYLDRIPDALATLARLEKWHPKFSRLFQERGYCHVALREAEPAIQSFVRAVNLNHALAASWKALQTLFRMTEQAQSAANADSHVAKLAELPPQIVTATGMLEDGELLAAEKIVRDYLLKHGNDVEAMRLLAKIGLELDVLDDAELLLESVLLLAPDYNAARYDYARVLLERHKHAPARAELDKLLQTEPNNRSYLTSYATACAGLGEHERAIALYRKLLVETPQAEELLLSIGHAQKTLGRSSEAIESYRAMPVRFRRRVLESCKPQDLSLRRRGDRAHAPRGVRRDDITRGSLSFLFRARQGAGGSGRLRRLVPLLPAGQCTEKIREPLSARDNRAKRAAAEADLHAAVLRRACRCRVYERCADIHRRIAPLRIDAAGTNSRIAFACRGHARAAGHPASGRGAGGARRRH